MNPLVTAIAGGVTRTLVAFLAGKGIDVGDDTMNAVVQGVIVIGVALWSARHKVQVDAKIVK